MVTGSTSPLEDALRWVATRLQQRPFGLLIHAMQDPDGESAAHLMPLVEPTASLPGGTPETRALAVWGLIIDAINNAEQTDRERRELPPNGDPHLLTISGGAVEHTFMEKCHPRESYGVSFLWPAP